MLTSRSQIARVFTEEWIAENGYCLACDSNRLMQTPANTQVRDFECSGCGHPYELKSSLRSFGEKVVDGAFASMMRRIQSKTVPSFLLLRYSDTRTVTDLTAIHHSLITPEIIEKRRPLSVTVRRAGWVGCNILLRNIPPEGRISLVDNGLYVSKSKTRSVFRATENLSTRTTLGRGWARAVLTCVHRIGTSRFTLDQAYAYVPELSRLYPDNRNIRAKIRQQLQVLRDAGLIVFERPGVYQIVFKEFRSERS